MQVTAKRPTHLPQLRSSEIRATGYRNLCPRSSSQTKGMELVGSIPHEFRSLVATCCEDAHRHSTSPGEPDGIAEPNAIVEPVDSVVRAGCHPCSPEACSYYLYLPAGYCCSYSPGVCNCCLYWPDGYCLSHSSVNFPDDCSCC